MRPRRVHHLRRCDARVLQEAVEPHLAGSVAAQRAQADPALAETQQPAQKKGPPFSSRLSPNWPRHVIIANRPLLRGNTESHIATDCKGILFRTCVHAVGLDPAIGHPHQIANDAIPVSNHPMKMTGSSPVMTGLDRCVRYVNSKGEQYDTAKI
jgi:hypothetical protein